MPVFFLVLCYNKSKPFAGGKAAMKVIDLTHTIREDMPVYPGTEQPKLTVAWLD